MYDMQTILKQQDQQKIYDRLMSLHQGLTLTNIESQELSTFRICMVSMPCFLCGLSNNVYEAIGAMDIAYDARKYKCRGCGIRLRHIVPFFMGIEPYHWGRPEDLTPREVNAAVTQWGELIDAIGKNETRSP
jgi:hypothetical protein